MSYWKDQPIDIIIDTNNDELKIIKPDISAEEYQLMMPNECRFKTLSPKHLDEIYGLISNHYVTDEQNIIRLTYSKDFLYWYLKYIPPGFVVGLVLKRKLVGVIMALFIDMVIYGKELRIPYVNFLCLQSKIRKLGLAPLMINEMKSRLLKNKMAYALFTGVNTVTKPFCKTNEFVVPLNYQKLKEVGFLTEELEPIPKLNRNVLHLMTTSDINSIVPKLNKSLEKFKVRPHFNEDSAHHFLLPKKNIVYSFVKRNDNNEVTDFVSVYKNYLYCLDQNKIISVAQLAFYYYETMNLTELITNLIDKLQVYKFDQLVFKDTAENTNINVTKFTTFGELNYFFYNVGIKETSPSLLCVFPF